VSSSAAGRRISARAAELLGIGCLLCAVGGCGVDTAPTSTALVATTQLEAPGDEVESSPIPTSTPHAEAVGLAQKALAAFADHSVSAEAWFANLAPFLSLEAQQDYLGTDPELVPVDQLQGRAQLQPPVSDFLATVTQDTDVGVYTVLLSRTDDGQWQVESITPPDGVGP
jgi:hypothetical protein